MKHLWLIVFGTATFACVVPWDLQAREARIAADPSETLEADEGLPAIPGFSGDQRQRLQQLRAWLERRKTERQSGGVIDPDRVKPQRELTVYSDRELLTPLGKRYALGFEKNRRNEPYDGRSRTLHIGRGADGRIHHRYVFGSPEQAEAEPEGTMPSMPPESRRAPPPGTGSIASRQRIVRIWTQDPMDGRTAPSLEYELPDQRR